MNIKTITTKSIILLLIIITPIISSSRTITGTVVEYGTDDPISGVSIQFKGTTNGAVTDLSGLFAIQTKSPADSILTFNHPGHVAREINVSKGNIHIVYMKEEVEQTFNYYFGKISFPLLTPKNMTKIPMRP